MNTTILETHASTTAVDGFTVLDACHQRTLAMLDELSLLVARLDHGGVDERARAQAAKIAGFFSTTARQRVRGAQRREMGREMAARHHAERASRRHSRT